MFLHRRVPAPHIFKANVAIPGLWMDYGLYRTRHPPGTTWDPARNPHPATRPGREPGRPARRAITAGVTGAQYGMAGGCGVVCGVPCGVSEGCAHHRERGECIYGVPQWSCTALMTRYCYHCQLYPALVYVLLQPAPAPLS